MKKKKKKETQLIILFHINNVDHNWPLEKVEHNRGLFVRLSSDYMLLSPFMVIALQTTASQAHLKWTSQAASSGASPSQKMCLGMDVSLADVLERDHGLFPVPFPGCTSSGPCWCSPLPSYNNKGISSMSTCSGRRQDLVTPEVAPAPVP